jgi:hypothetical protein
MSRKYMKATIEIMVHVKLTNKGKHSIEVKNNEIPVFASALLVQ